jgi:hypothetical protein
MAKRSRRKECRSTPRRGCFSPMSCYIITSTHSIQYNLHSTFILHLSNLRYYVGSFHCYLSPGAAPNSSRSVCGTSARAARAIYWPVHLFLESFPGSWAATKPSQLPSPHFSPFRWSGPLGRREKSSLPLRCSALLCCTLRDRNHPLSFFLSVHLHLHIPHLLSFCSC